MVKTQAVNATEVAYVLNDFMGVHTGSRLPEILRLKGIININGIASISFAVIDKLTYKDPDDNSTQPLNSGEKQLLKMFIVYTHRLSDNDAIPEYWNKTTLDPKTFRKFQMSQEPHTRISCVYSNTDYKDAIAAATTTTTANPTGTHSIANHINVFNKNTTLLSEWMKHKRDSKTYPDLTSEDKNWDSWNRTVKALARNDQTSQVLDPVYVATSVDEKELFERQQTFMYVVFNCTVLTDVGKTIVRKHESTYDAQKVYSDLLDHHSKSTMAMIGKQDIFAEIVIMSINSWPASQTKFLLAWKDRLRIYKELNAGIDINDMQKTTLLQIAVQGAPSLARIKDDADILSTQLNKSLTFDEYYRLLESAAQQFDSLTERNTAGTRKAHRQTLRHDVFEHHTPLDSADDFSVLDMSYYDAMRTSQQQHQRTTPPADQRPCVRLADDQWKDLEDKARTLGSLSRHPTRPSFYATVPCNTPTPRPPNKYTSLHHSASNLTQLSSWCRAASYHLGEHPSPKDAHSKASDVTWDASTMTGSVNRTNLKIGDPRKMLSNRLAKTPTGPIASPTTEGHHWWSRRWFFRH
jgi:hypothetical protein